MNENLPMGGLNPEELKEALQGVADEYVEGVWALEYIAQLEAEKEQLQKVVDHISLIPVGPHQFVADYEEWQAENKRLCKALGENDDRGDPEIIA